METQQTKYIAYYRVSTIKQDKSGLGLEAQVEIVRKHCVAGTIIAEYTEVESGKSNKRPHLRAALAQAKQTNSVIVIAKLDRLSRNMAFIANILEAGVEFVCCDFPQANRFMLHILAAVAEYERKLISERTKATLAILKAKGIKLGSPNPEIGNKASAISRHANSVLNNPELQLIAKELKEKGYNYLQIIERLSKQGFTTPKGNRLTPAHISRLLNA